MLGYELLWGGRPFTVRNRAQASFFLRPISGGVCLRLAILISHKLAALSDAGGEFHCSHVWSRTFAYSRLFCGDDELTSWRVGEPVCGVLESITAKEKGAIASSMLVGWAFTTFQELFVLEYFERKVRCPKHLFVFPGAPECEHISR